MLGQASIDKLKENDIVVNPMITQFGWQFERRLFANKDGLTALTEWVPLISGLEQGVALPSLNWLVGIRTATGAEFGIGPNVTPARGRPGHRRRRDGAIRRAQHPAQFRRRLVEDRGARQHHDGIQLAKALKPG